MLRAGEGDPLRLLERSIAAALEQAIVQRIGEPRYKLWFENHTKFSWDGDQLTIGVPNRHFEEWLQKTFGEAVRAAAAEVFGQAMIVRFLIDPELFQAARREQEEVQAARRAPPGEPRREELSTRPNSGERGSGKGPSRPMEPAAPEPAAETATGHADQTRPAARKEEKARGQKPSRRWHRLEEFVVGACNRVAHASAVSLVETPRETPVPLVLHGSVGTGKSHLLQGVYVGLRRAYPDWRVLFVTAEDFTNRFVQSMRLDRQGAFRKFFRECDALLMDDIHFLARKKATREEFLHTLDALQADGKPVIVTCDCHPRLADDFEPELIDRLLGGAVWGVMPPDFDTRLAILRSKVLKTGDTLIADEVLRYLAEHLRGNVRELEGALNSLRHFSRVTGRRIDVDLAREALAELLRHSVRVVQLVDVDAAICKVLRLDSGALQSKQRAWAVSHPRMLAMYLARKHTTAAYSEIGHHFGGRNHSTAVAAEKKVRQWLQSNGEVNLGERTLRVREIVELAERELLR
jgi:chromosomal replication initiator protein